MAAVVGVNMLFPNHRGHVTGIVKSASAVGSSVLALVFSDFLQYDTLDYFVYVASYVPALALVGMIFIVTGQKHDGTMAEENGIVGRLHIYYGILAIEVIYVFIVSLVNSTDGKVYVAVIAIVILLLTCLVPFVRRPADRSDAPLWTWASLYFWQVRACGGREAGAGEEGWPGNGAEEGGVAAAAADGGIGYVEKSRGCCCLP